MNEYKQQDYSEESKVQDKPILDCTPMAFACLLILQKYSNIDGYQERLKELKIDKQVEESITRLLWRKGYLTGLTISQLKPSSLGEHTLEVAMSNSEGFTIKHNKQP